MKTTATLNNICKEVGVCPPIPTDIAIKGGKMSEEKPKCDVDDILCQLGLLSHLRGMKASLGSEDFNSKFPEFEGWDQKIVDTIRKQEVDLSKALEGCGLSSAEELRGIHSVILPAQITREGEAPEE